MFKYTATYTDFNGITRTEDFYFNITKAELAELQMTTAGGMKEKLERIINANDLPTLITMFKDIMLMAYGVKSDDGKRFKKSPEITADFVSTQAYSDLYMRLATDDEFASNFILKVVPNDIAEEAKKSRFAIPSAT